MDIVAIVRFGKHSTEGIVRSLIRLNIKYGIVLPHEIPSFEPSHIILSGGPKHVYEADYYPMPEWVIKSKAPVLGICYGMQLIVQTYRGIVRRMAEKEKGLIEVTEIINGKQSVYPRWMNRQDQVLSIPNRFTVTGVTNTNDIAAFTDGYKWWAIQYHPETRKWWDLNVFRRFLNIKHVN